MHHLRSDWIKIKFIYISDEETRQIQQIWVDLTPDEWIFLLFPVNNADNTSQNQSIEHRFRVAKSTIPLNFCTSIKVLLYSSTFIHSNVIRRLIIYWQLETCKNRFKSAAKIQLYQLYLSVRHNFKPIATNYRIRWSDCNQLRVSMVSIALNHTTHSGTK